MASHSSGTGRSTEASRTGSRLAFLPWLVLIGLVTPALATNGRLESQTLRNRLEGQQRQQNLELEAQQSQYRRRREPETHGGQAALDQRLEQQRRAQRELHLRQRQDAAVLRQRSRVISRPAVVRGRRPQLELQRFRREQQVQQSRFRMQRDSWPYPRRSPVR
jgi:hypothetical protein